MLVKVRPRWEIPEREAAPESSYHSRRTVLKALGFMGLESLGLQARDPNGPYPAKRSPKYRLDRPITPQWAATGYNNFYEFTLRKERVKDVVGRFTIDPWTVEVNGLVNNPRKYDFDDLIQRFPLEERLYRMRCVEAWSMAVPWTGFPISALVKEVDPIQRPATFAWLPPTGQARCRVSGRNHTIPGRTSRRCVWMKP